MRFMEWIRRRGHWFLWGILIIFTITLFFGLTTGADVWSGGQGVDGRMTPGPTPTLVRDGKLADVAVRVNGREISNGVFQETLGYMLASMGGTNSDDPTSTLEAYGYTASYLVGQELIMARGEELGVELTAEDLAEAKKEAAASYVEREKRQSGNVVGDLVGKLGDIRAEREAFRRYLEAQGLTEEQWERASFRSLYPDKVRDEIQRDAEAGKVAEAEKTKAEIDAKLAAGESFADLAREYSDGMSAEAGGDLDWIGRPLLTEPVADAVFGTAVGETTEWLTIPAGWQRFEVYEKREASGEAFEAKKPELITQIRVAKSDDQYEPSESEIAREYEQVRVRAIELHTSDPMAAQVILAELSETAVVEFNHPYVLAYQAMRDAKIQPLADVDYDRLVQLAQRAPIGEGYSFEPIRAKLEAGRKVAVATPEDTAAEIDESAAADTSGDTYTAANAETTEADAAATDESSTADASDDVVADEPVEDTTPSTDEELARKPSYALAIGLLKLGIEEGATTEHGAFPYFMASKLYMDWMNDTENLRDQPLDRDAARADMEQMLARVVEVNTYSAQARAWRGLNLAWLDKDEQALEELELARKYAARQDGPVWQDVKQAYQVLDLRDKEAEIDALLTEFRQEMLRSYLEGSAGGGQEGQVISVPMEDIVNTDSLPGVVNTDSLVDDPETE